MQPAVPTASTTSEWGLLDPPDFDSDGDEFIGFDNPIDVSKPPIGGDSVTGYSGGESVTAAAGGEPVISDACGGPVIAAAGGEPVTAELEEERVDDGVTETSVRLESDLPQDVDDCEAESGSRQASPSARSENEDWGFGGVGMPPPMEVRMVYLLLTSDY